MNKTAKNEWHITGHNCKILIIANYLSNHCLNKKKTSRGILNKNYAFLCITGILSEITKEF